MSTLRFAGRLLRNTSGAAAIMAGVAVPAVLGTAALSIDIGNWYLQRSELQSIADVVAASAALERAYGNGYSVESAHGEAEMTGIDTSEISDLTINWPPQSGAYAGDTGAVEVLVSAPGTVFFAGALFDTAFDITARAVATSGVLVEACLVGLDESSPEAIQVSGNATVGLECGIASNSDDNRSVRLNGNITLDVPSLSTAGQIQDTTNGALDDVATRENGRRMDDPYSGLTPPFFSGCDYQNTQINNSAVLSPGVYCGGIKIGGNGSVQFDPGEYILDAGDFEITGNPDVYGTDVTIILTSTTYDYGNLKITGGSNVDMTAPTSGNYEGVLMFQDRNAPPFGSGGPGSYNTVTGNASLVALTGALYFPAQELRFGGTGGFASECLQIIGAAVTVTGDFTIDDRCDDLSMPVRSIGNQRAALVE